MSRRARARFLARHPVVRHARVDAELERHLRRFFSGHAFEEARITGEGVRHRFPHLRVVAIGPGPRAEFWTYASIGAWRATGGRRGVEFLVTTADATGEGALAVEMLAFYHSNDEDESYRLDVGHTVPIGDPWLHPDSQLTHTLLSLPYPFGAELGVCHAAGVHVDYLWALTITDAERRYVHEVGLDELEERLDAASIDFLDPHRPSVV